MKRRISVLLLSMLMVLMMVPSMAFADDGEYNFDIEVTEARWTDVNRLNVEMEIVGDTDTAWFELIDATKVGLVYTDESGAQQVRWIEELKDYNYTGSSSTSYARMLGEDSIQIYLPDEYDFKYKSVIVDTGAMWDFDEMDEEIVNNSASGTIEHRTPSFSTYGLTVNDTSVNSSTEAIELPAEGGEVTIGFSGNWLKGDAGDGLKVTLSSSENPEITVSGTATASDNTHGTATLTIPANESTDAIVYDQVTLSAGNEDVVDAVRTLKDEDASTPYDSTIIVAGKTADAEDDDKDDDKPSDFKLGASAISTTAVPSNNSVVATIKPVANATDYCISYRKIGAKTWKTVCFSNKTTYTLKGFTKNGLYEFKVQASAKLEDGTTVEGPYSSVNRRYYARTSFKAKAGKKKITVTNKKASGATGYKIYVSTNKNMKNAKVYTTKSTKKVIKGLKSGKTYYVRTVPYKTYGGKTYTGIRNSVKKVKVK